ncbi:MAG: nucleoside hydrolase [Bacteroidia bacterium]
MNATRNGGDIHQQYQEAQRILALYNLDAKIPLLKGANASYPQIDSLPEDGLEAVEFMLQKTRENPGTVIIAVGKLTTVARALKNDPDLANRTRIVWLGSNYPEPGEYNQENDTAAMNYVLSTPVPFEMVTVRYGKPSGTDAVRATPQEIADKMPGAGPLAEKPVEGRNGGSFTHFGDYSLDLFSHIDLHGNPPSRALFDMVAVAVVKIRNGQRKNHSCPHTHK